jgi:hypothetical protein
MSLFISYLFLITYFVIQIEFNDTVNCGCLNNSTCVRIIEYDCNYTYCECKLNYYGNKCEYCLYCFSNNKTCSINGDTRCDSVLSAPKYTHIWFYFIFLALFIVSFLCCFFSFCFLLKLLLDLKL